MDRPSKADPRIRDIALEKIWPAIEKWLKANGDPADEQDKQSAKEVLDDVGQGADGYEIAKDFEHAGWCPDSEFVEVMDDYAWKLAEAYNQLVEAWVKGHSIEPPLEVGTMVTTTNLGKPVTGEITQVWKSRAQYTVFVPSLGHKKKADALTGSATLGILANYEDCAEVKNEVPN